MKGVTLKQIRNTVNAYIALYGDKHVISFSTYTGTESDVAYSINVCDIYDGPVGSMPYTNKDEIKLLKIDMSDSKNSDNTECTDMTTDHENVMKAYYDLEQELRKAKEKPIELRLAMIWSAVSLLQRMGEIDKNKMYELWNDFALRELDLK